MKRTAATLLIGLGTGLALTACDPDQGSRGIPNYVEGGEQ